MSYVQAATRIAPRAHRATQTRANRLTVGLHAAFLAFGVARSTFASAVTGGLNTLAAPSVSASPSAAVTSKGTFLNAPAAGIPFVAYDTTTGDAVFYLNGFAPPPSHLVCEVDVFSSKRLLQVQNVNRAAAPFISAFPDEIDYQSLAGAIPGFNIEIVDGSDLGNIFPAMVDPNTLANGDYSSALYLFALPGPYKAVPFVRFFAAPTPEPTSLSLIGLGSLIVFARRRRQFPESRTN